VEGAGGKNKGMDEESEGRMKERGKRKRRIRHGGV